MPHAAHRGLADLALTRYDFTPTHLDDGEQLGCTPGPTLHEAGNRLFLQSGFGDGCGLQILAVFPSFVLQQIRNSLAVRRMPKGLETTELIWTAFGFEDDSPKLTEMRLRQAKLVGPAGYVSIRAAFACRTDSAEPVTGNSVLVPVLRGLLPFCVAS